MPQLDLDCRNKSQKTQNQRCVRTERGSLTRSNFELRWSNKPFPPLPPPICCASQSRAPPLESPTPVFKAGRPLSRDVWLECRACGSKGAAHTGAPPTKTNQHEKTPKHRPKTK